MSVQERVHLVLCVDNSRSMEAADVPAEAGSADQRRCDAVADRCRKLLEAQLPHAERVLVSFILFDDEATKTIVAQPLTAALAASLTSGARRPRGGTNYAEALFAVRDVVQAGRQRGGRAAVRTTLVFLSDGRPGELRARVPALGAEPKTCRYRKQNKMSAPETLRELVRSGAFALYAIGVGQADSQWLRRLAEIAAAEGATGEFDEVGGGGALNLAGSAAPAAAQPAPAATAPAAAAAPEGGSGGQFEVGSAVQLAPYSNSRDILKPGTSGIVAEVLRGGTKDAVCQVMIADGRLTMLRAQTLQASSHARDSLNKMRKQLATKLMDEAHRCSSGAFVTAADAVRKQELLRRARQVHASIEAKRPAAKPAAQGPPGGLQPVPENDRATQPPPARNGAMMPPPARLAMRNSASLSNAFDSISSSITSSIGGAAHRKEREYRPEHGNAWKDEAGWPKPESAQRLESTGGQERWEDVTVRLRPNPFAQGGQRNAYHMQLISVGGKRLGTAEHAVHCVAKESRYEGEDSERLSTLKAEMEETRLATELAVRFNREVGQKGTEITVVPCQVYRLPLPHGAGFRYMSVEQFLPGTFVKHNGT